MTIDDMREQLRMMFTGGGRNGAVAALAQRVSRNLMLFNNRLHDLASGESVALPVEQDALVYPAEAIAEAAAILTGVKHGGVDCIQLLLPPAEFLPQSVNLPGLSVSDIQAALKLQAVTRLPELEHDLVPCLNNNPHTGQPAESIAWWLPTARANNLHDAFAARAMFLAAILPRPAWLAQSLVNRSKALLPVILDQDAHTQTVLGQINGEGDAKPLHCLQTATADLTDPDIAHTWQTELGQLELSIPEISLNSAEDYQRLVRARDLPVLDAAVSQRAIFPEAALAARHQIDRGKRLQSLLKVAAAVVAIIMVPGLYQSWQLASLGSKLEDLREAATEPRASQSAVRDFETQWGVLTEFPDQDVIEVMLALQRVINPGVLSSFSIDKGSISIEGESNDPQNVLEMLEQHPLFAEVDFARATNNNRYFIDLRLSTVNFPAYQEWHFPGQR